MQFLVTVDSSEEDLSQHERETILKLWESDSSSASSSSDDSKSTSSEKKKKKKKGSKKASGSKKKPKIAQKAKKEKKEPKTKKRTRKNVDGEVKKEVPVRSSACVRVAYVVDQTRMQAHAAEGDQGHGGKDEKKKRISMAQKATITNYVCTCTCGDHDKCWYMCDLSNMLAKALNRASAKIKAGTAAIGDAPPAHMQRG